MTTTTNYLTNEFRQVFRNLDTTERVRKIDIEEWVKYCKRAGATVLILDIKNYCALYDSKFLPKHPVLGKRDLAAELATAAKKHGMKYGYYYSAPARTTAWRGSTTTGSNASRTAHGRRSVGARGPFSAPVTPRFGN